MTLLPPFSGRYCSDPASGGGTIDDYAFPNRINPSLHMSARQYARLVDEWVTAIGLRREAVQILGHTKIENTVRYPGLDIEDALALAE